MKKHLAFTLAEIMIVFVVIGILTGILLPVANNSGPDEKVMKFKKANATLSNAITKLVRSDLYYKDGDLGIKPDGRLIDGNNTGDRSYFCETFADLVSVKSKNCSDMENITPEEGIVYGGTYKADLSDYIDNNKNAYDDADLVCSLSGEVNSAWADCNAVVKTNDGISYIMMGACDPFGAQNINDGGKRSYYNKDTIDGNYFGGNSGGIRYKFICIDIDEINEGESPFGYLVRSDGRVIAGTKAKEWMDKSTRKGNNE